YSMTFNAMMHRARLVDPGSNAIEAIVKRLNKMLKDDKNIEYQDQIFYSLANISQKENNIEKAKENYLTSTQVSVNNDHQKGLSFYELGKIYFEELDYNNAQVFYDSANILLDVEFDEKVEVGRISQNLNRLVENLNVVTDEDSLQAVAAMEEDERDALINKIIEEVIEQERLKKEKETEDRLNRQPNRMLTNSFNVNNQNTGGQTQNMPQMGGNTQTSSWYFYNPTTVSYGQSEFLNKWGRRKLEDDWRRKNKSIIGIDQSDGMEGDLGGYEDVSLNKNKNTGLEKTTKEYYLADLPLTDSLINLSNLRIIQALFNIGILYKDEFKDFSKSIGSFEALNTRFPENEKLLFSYFNLYEIHKQLQQVSEEEKYKDLIINKFPYSRSASIVSNPNYFQEIEAVRQEVKTYYLETYELFLNNDYSGVMEKCILSDSLYNRNYLRPKFLFLKVLSMLKLPEYEMPAVRNELIGLIATYPASEVKKPADDLLSAIRKVSVDNGVISIDENTDDAAVIVQEKEPEKEIYTLNEDDIHYYVLIVENKTNVNQLKYDIVNFNVDFILTDIPNVSSLLLNMDMHLIIVKKFDGKDKALTYLHAFIENGEVLNKFNETDYRHFVISKENYKTFYQDKDVSKYLKFYNINYK
ncbi:tol-pal system YbgF family protein, partial [Bacteroidota bacterium]